MKNPADTVIWRWVGDDEDDTWFEIYPNGGFDLSPNGFVPSLEQIVEICKVLEHLRMLSENDEYLQMIEDTR